MQRVVVARRRKWQKQRGASSRNSKHRKGVSASRSRRSLIVQPHHSTFDSMAKRRSNLRIDRFRCAIDAEASRLRICDRARVRLASAPRCLRLPPSVVRFAVLPALERRSPPRDCSRRSAGSKHAADARPEQRVLWESCTALDADSVGTDSVQPRIAPHAATRSIQLAALHSHGRSRSRRRGRVDSRSYRPASSAAVPAFHIARRDRPVAHTGAGRFGSRVRFARSPSLQHWSRGDSCARALSHLCVSACLLCGCVFRDVAARACWCSASPVAARRRFDRTHTTSPAPLDARLSASCSSSEEGRPRGRPAAIQR